MGRFDDILSSEGDAWRQTESRYERRYPRISHKREKNTCISQI